MSFDLISSALAQSQPAANPAQSQGSSLGLFAPLLAVFAIFYFLMIRPQQKQQNLRKKMLTELKKGDQVVTVSGLHGKIVGIADQVLTVEIAENLKVKMEREAVSRIKTDSNAAESKK